MTSKTFNTTDLSIYKWETFCSLFQIALAFAAT